MTDKRKRAAPTIDLKATEVPPEASESASAPESPSQQSAPPPEPPPSEDAQAAPEQHADAPEPPRAEQPAPPRRGSAGVYAAAIASGIAGAAVVIAAFAALWYAGLLPLRTPPANDQSARLEALQKQIAELQNKPSPAPAAPDTQAVDALRNRIAKIEHEIANRPPGDTTVAERLASADNTMKSLGGALAALNKRSDETAAKAAQAEAQAAAAEKAVNDLRDSVQNAGRQASSAVDTAALDALQQRVEAVEQSVKAARAQIARASAADKAARLALSAAALRDAVRSGAPYQAELAQTKSLGGDEKTLAPLAQFAASGLPGKATLARELQALVPAMLKASGAQTPPSGFLDRLQANAGSLVRISPVDAPEGDKPADVLARIEVDAAHADIGAALTDLSKLPASARAPAQGWIAKAQARAAALAAAHSFAADTARALGKS